MKNTTVEKIYAMIAVDLFVALTVWWGVLFYLGLVEDFRNYLFGAAYGLMALFGGIIGLHISRIWGGMKSVVGKAVLFLSLGLFAAEFGQIIFSYYNIFLNIEIPYPSLADIGFFANIPLYSLGIFYLAKASGVLISIKKVTSKVQAIVIPGVVLILSYIFFLQGYEFDWSAPIKIFLDFGYPLGQAFYVSLALLTFTLSRRMLGGRMKNGVSFILVAFFAQYIADYNFLFQTSRGTWINAGYGDYLYLVAYFLMTLGIIRLMTIHSELSGKN